VQPKQGKVLRKDYVFGSVKFQVSLCIALKISNEPLFIGGLA
jgi:hypothetical protein